MLRDILKDKEHFDKFIEGEIIGIERRKIRFRNNEVREDARDSVAEGIYEEYLYLVFAMYSRGDDLEDIKKVFFELIDAYYFAYKEDGIDYSRFDPNYDFAKLMVTIGLLILFDIKGEPLKKALEVLNTAPNFQIVNRYLSFLGVHREPLAEPHKFERAFKGLNEMFTISNEEIINNKLMNKYLKTWYNSEARVFIKDMHDLPGYHGYWAFETAAFVKMRGLDDSSFRDNVYYPKDLADYSKANK